jgi:hypothetical protein
MKRLRDKPYRGRVPKTGGARPNYIEYITIGGEHGRNRIDSGCARPKSGKRRSFSTLLKEKK